MRMDPPVSALMEASDIPVATATAEPPLIRPRRGSDPADAGRTKRRLVARRPERELVQIALAYQHGPRMTQRGGHRGIRAGRRRVEHARARGRRHAALIDQIFERDRNAVQRAEPLPARPRAVGPRALERLFTGHRNEGIQRWIEPFDHVETLARKTHRREAVTKLSQRLLDRAWR